MSVIGFRLGVGTPRGYVVRMAPVKNPAARVVLLSLGWVFVAIAFIGIIMPVVPTTGPVLLAGFLFSKSSERFDRWLLGHRLFGPIVRDWRAGLGFSKKLKTIAIIGIVATFTLTLTVAITEPLGRGLMIALALGLIVYILRLPTKPAEVAERV